MVSVKERISRHPLMDDRFGTIALVEDEIDDIVERIYKSKAILQQYRVNGNASMLSKKSEEYLIKMNNSEIIYLYKNLYAGSCIDKGIKLQCGNIKAPLNNRKVCVDVMEGLPYNALNSHVENYDIIRPYTYSWTLYGKHKIEIRKR